MAFILRIQMLLTKRKFIYKVTFNQFPLTSFETVILKSAYLTTTTCRGAKPSTSLITTSSSASIYSCDKFGFYLGGNPLVEEGIIPEALSEFFQPVPAKPLTAKKTNKQNRWIIEGRVITSDTFYQQLVNKTEEERRRKEIECRKVQIGMKETEAEKENKGKYPENGRKTSSMNKKKDVCEICKEAEPATLDDELDVLWICCDLL